MEDALGLSPDLGRVEQPGGSGVLELVLPVEERDEAATVMVVVFIAAPIGRVIWLMVRWARLGDRRFALVGAALLAVVATGFLAR